MYITVCLFIIVVDQMILTVYNIADESSKRAAFLCTCFWILYETFPLRSISCLAENYDTG